MYSSIHRLLATLLLLMFLTGCNNQNIDDIVGEVTVISNGVSYIPYRQGISGSNGRGGIWDGMPPALEKLIDEAPLIRYSEDFEFVLSGGNATRGHYALYDSKMEQLYYRLESGFRLPPHHGEYILCLTQTWGDSKRYTSVYGTYGYYVRLLIEEESLPKKDSIDDVVGNVIIVSGGNEYLLLPRTVTSLVNRTSTDPGEYVTESYDDGDISVIDYGNDFEVRFEGGMQLGQKPLAAIFGDKNKRIFYFSGKLSDLAMPWDAGEYYVDLTVIWANGNLSWSRGDLYASERISLMMDYRFMLIKQ